MKTLFIRQNFKFFGRLSLSVFLLLTFFARASEANLQEEVSDGHGLVERVLAVVGCGSSKKIITSSEVGRFDFFNGIESLTLEQIIDQKVILLEAESFKIGNFKITVSPAEIDSKIERAKASFGFPGIANEKFNKILEEKGFSLAILKEQALQDGMISHMMSFMFPDKAVVSSEKIVEFCRKNPEMIEEQVRLEACEMPVEEFKKLKAKFALKDGQINMPELEKSLTLFDLGFLTTQDLEKETIAILGRMEIGDLHLPTISKGSTEETVRILKLVERQKRREKTIDERKAKVSEALYLQDRTKKYHDYINELREQAHVVRFDQ